MCYLFYYFSNPKGGPHLDCNVYNYKMWAHNVGTQTSLAGPDWTAACSTTSIRFLGVREIQAETKSSMCPTFCAFHYAILANTGDISHDMASHDISLCFTAESRGAEGNTALWVIRAYPNALPPIWLGSDSGQRHQGPLPCPANLQRYTCPNLSLIRHNTSGIINTVLLLESWHEQMTLQHINALVLRRVSSESWTEWWTWP